MSEKKRGLGRGLSALIGDVNVELDPQTVGNLAAQEHGFRLLGVDMLQPSAFQPRQTFSEKDLDELSKSLKEKGVLQPLLVRPLEGSAEKFEIVAGERRWRAAQRAQLHEVPVLIRHLSNIEALEIAIIENVQRADLNPIDESLAYQRLMGEFSYTQEQLAKTLGKSRSHIANMIRLTGVTEKIKSLLIEGKLSTGHARALLNYPDADRLGARIVAEGLSVREVEKIVALGKTPSKTTANKKRTETEKDVDTLALEKSVREAVGLAVDIKHKGVAGGTLSLSYKTLEQLDDIIARLMRRNV